MARPKRQVGDRWTVEDSIRARKGTRGVRYQVQLTAPDGKRQTFKAGSLAEARSIRDRERTAMRDGNAVKPSKWTLATYADHWFSSLQKRRSTRRQYASNINHLKAAPFAGSKLKDISPAAVESFIGNLETLSRKGRPSRPASVQTKTAVYVLLNMILGSAKREGLIRDNPCGEVKRPAREGSKPRRQVPEHGNYQRGSMVLAESDVHELLAHLEHHNPAMWLPAFILWRTGLRRGELLALRWNCVYLDNDPPEVWITCTESDGDVQDTPKTTRSHAPVEIDPELAAALRQRRDDQRAAVAELSGRAPTAGDVASWFVVSHDHAPATVRRGSNFTQQLQRALTGTRFAAMSPHDLRHAHGSHLLSVGFSLPDVAARLRDSVGTLAKVYAHAIRKERGIGAAFGSPVVESGKPAEGPALRVVK